MLHGLFYDESGEMDRKIYEVRTRKILSYSNVIASASNLIYVGVNAGLGNESALKSLDIGGLIVTVYRVVTDKKFIRKAKREFIEQEFLDRIRGSEFDFWINSEHNWVKKGLAALKDTLGVTGTIRFLEQFDHGGSGDYTAEKYLQEEAEPTDEEIRKMFGY